ncbi:hypothetical protein BASA82_000020 [Batrachochytrium salamandrivorans]|nr:hypothetical protein BASA82_000020 [Batrachochytrium salamandrivorans]
MGRRSGGRQRVLVGISIQQIVRALALLVASHDHCSCIQPSVIESPIQSKVRSLVWGRVPGPARDPLPLPPPSPPPPANQQPTTTPHFYCPTTHNNQPNSSLLMSSSGSEEEEEQVVESKNLTGKQRKKMKRAAEKAALVASGAVAAELPVLMNTHSQPQVVSAISTAQHKAFGFLKLEVWSRGAQKGQDARQPLAKQYLEPTLAPNNFSEWFDDASKPLGIDIGCAAGRFAFMMSCHENSKFPGVNHLGLEIRKSVAEILDEGAWFFVQSDVEEAAAQMRDRMTSSPRYLSETGFTHPETQCWRLIACGAADYGDWRIGENPMGVPTEREVQNEALGLPIYRALFVRTGPKRAVRAEGEVVSAPAGSEASQEPWTLVETVVPPFNRGFVPTSFLVLVKAQPAGRSGPSSSKASAVSTPLPTSSSSNNNWDNDSQHSFDSQPQQSRKQQQMGNTGPASSKSGSVRRLSDPRLAQQLLNVLAIHPPESTWAVAGSDKAPPTATRASTSTCLPSTTGSSSKSCTSATRNSKRWTRPRWSLRGGRKAPRRRLTRSRRTCSTHQHRRGERRKWKEKLNEQVNVYHA